MRHCDPHDDPPRRRRPERYRGPPVTLGHIRSHGVKRLLVYCTNGSHCHHSAAAWRTFLRLASLTQVSCRRGVPLSPSKRIRVSLGAQQHQG